MKITHLSAIALATIMAVSAPLAVHAQDDDTIIMLGGPSSDPFWGAVQQGFNTAASGCEAAHRLLAQPQRPTAIFASNDDMAAGVLVAAHERGISVPSDLSVAGFDDTELASIVWPKLTTVHQPVYEMSYRATDVVIDLIKGVAPPRVIWLDYGLKKRGSTASPAS